MANTLLSNADLIAARDKAYANASAPGMSDHDYGIWMAMGDRIEGDRQKITAKLIDLGSEAYQKSQDTITDATQKLAKANATIDGNGASLQAFGNLVASVDNLVTTVLPLFA